MKIVNMHDVRAWYLQSDDLAEFSRSIGRLERDAQILRPIDLPLHLQFVIQAKAAETTGPVSANAFTSISFFSLWKGLFLPLSGLAPERVAQLFGFTVPPVTDDGETLVKNFLAKEV